MFENSGNFPWFYCKDEDLIRRLIELILETGAGKCFVAKVGDKFYVSYGVFHVPEEKIKEKAKELGGGIKQGSRLSLFEVAFLLLRASLFLLFFL